MYVVNTHAQAIEIGKTSGHSSFAGKNNSANGTAGTGSGSGLHTPNNGANGGNGSVAYPKSGFMAEYELKEEIGVGSTSKCFRCLRKIDGKEFACKVIDKRHVEAKFNGLLDQFFVEIKVLKSLNHPNIIHLQDTYETPDRIYMVMEMMKGE